MDCGIKQSILSRLKERGCNVTIVPFNTPAKDILAFNPDGVLLSNGPVSALEAPEILALVQELKGRVPVFGIGLGMEAIGLSYGAKLVPMGCGKHGDYPVRDLESGRINIAVLNQTYRFDTVEGTGLTPTHVLVPEGYVLGFENKADQGRPGVRRPVPPGVGPGSAGLRVSFRQFHSNDGGAAPCLGERISRK